MQIRVLGNRLIGKEVNKALPIILPRGHVRPAMVVMQWHLALEWAANINGDD